MITVRECTYDDRKQYDQLEGKYHYMGESHGAGDTMRLIVEEDGKWIALMTWAASCYALKPRDERIGWNPSQRVPRLKLIVNNRRFTELVEKGTRPNLASKILGLVIRELPAMWRRKWGYEPLLAETFCDVGKVEGTCYRAAGWERVGQTKGFSRVRHASDYYVPNGKAKVLYMKPLRPKAWDLIVSNELPEECLAATHTKAIGVLPFKTGQIDDLFMEFCRVKDPRGRNRKFGIGTLLTLYTMGVAAGGKDLKDVVSFVKRLTDKQLKELGCPRQKDVNNKPIDGKYVCPSYTAFHHLLTHKDKAGRRDFDLESYAEHLSNWMTAQAGKLPRQLAADGKFIKETVGIVSFVDAESKEVLAVAPLSRKEGEKGKCELPMTQKVMSRMDLSEVVVSTDALGCQTKSAHIALERGGDYVFQVKGNQKDLLQNCKDKCEIRPRVDVVKKKN